jgi:hypothetical protein
MQNELYMGEAQVHALAKKYANVKANDNSFLAQNMCWELWDIYCNCGIVPNKFTATQQQFLNELNALCSVVDEPLSYTIQLVADASNCYRTI